MIFRKIDIHDKFKILSNKDTLPYFESPTFSTDDAFRIFVKEFKGVKDKAKLTKLVTALKDNKVRFSLMVYSNQAFFVYYQVNPVTKKLRYDIVHCINPDLYEPVIVEMSKMNRQNIELERHLPLISDIVKPWSKNNKDRSLLLFNNVNKSIKFGLSQLMFHFENMMNILSLSPTSQQVYLFKQ
jgi:hypothetical protein